MESLVENIDQIAQHDFDNQKVFGCNYFVYYKGEKVEKCYGTISLNSDNPVTNTTLFRLASMTKPITAVATLILVEKGLLALDDYRKQYEGESRFLSFAIHFFLQFFLKQMDNELIFQLLKNYVTTLPVEEQQEGIMIVQVLEKIASGAHPELLREIIASYVGVGYWERLEAVRRGEQGKCTREEIIDKYKEKELFSEKTDLLERFETVGDFEIRVVLRNLENETLAAALNGASGNIVIRFLMNLSDRLLYFVSEDVDRWNGTEEEILNAQRKVLAVGGCFLTE